MLDASLRRLSRICARVQAAKPKTNAGFSFAWMQNDDSGDGLTPISRVTRLVIGKSSSRLSQATKFNPASGICRVKRSPSTRVFHIFGVDAIVIGTRLKHNIVENITVSPGLVLIPRG